MAQPVNAAEMRNKQLPPGRVDPDVKIPKQILEAGKRSEEIQQAIAGAAEPSVATQVEQQANPPAQGEQPPVQPQQAPPQQPEQPQQPESEETWERRFKSLNGRIEAENKRMRDSIAQLSDRAQELERENRLLRSAPAPQANGHAQEQRPLLSDAEIEEYGPDFVDVMRRVAAETVERTAQPLNEEINTLRAQMGHVQQETGNAFLNRMNQTIEARVPNWAALNKHPKFIEWSQLPDVFSGAIRKGLMQEAWNSGQPERVAAFFQAFLAEEAATNPQGQPVQQRPPSSGLIVSDTPMDPRTVGASLDLATLAAPGRAHSAGGTPVEKPVYTAAEITRFYTDVAAGRWRGRDQQRLAIDHDISLAQREGRIILDQRTVAPRDPYMR